MREIDERESNVKKMFERLNEHIGEEVSYFGWWYGNQNEGKGELKEVNYFDNVVIGNMGMPFVGYGAIIVEIISQDGEILYANPYAESEYDRRTDKEIFAAKREIFGDRVADIQQARKEKFDKKVEEAIKMGDEQAKKAKYQLMKEGITLVKPEMIQEWLEFADMNSDDGYSVCVVKASISMMKKFEEGISFEEAEHQVFGDELGLSGFQAGCASSAISYFSKHGEEYRKYWNSQFGQQGEEAEGVINPAVLYIKK